MSSSRCTLYAGNDENLTVTLCGAAYACARNSQHADPSQHDCSFIWCTLRILVAAGGAIAEEVIVRTYYSLTLGILLAAVANVAASAEMNLTGRWVGPFNGVQVEISVEPGPFGYQNGEPRTVQGPRFVETTLHIDFEDQRQGLAVGTWSTANFRQRFACAQINETVWNCVDSGGRASLEVRSASEIKVCYLDNRLGSQGAGCALLRKVG
jgi:hypothetical protein